MNKEIYFRNIILSGTKEDNKQALSIIPGWEFKTKNVKGINHYCIENKEINAQILFDPEIKQSTNVIPVNPYMGDIYNKYEDGYDMSKNQKSNIKDDILYSLCILINDTIDNYNNKIQIKEKYLKVLCGIVPSKYDSLQMN